MSHAMFGFNGDIVPTFYKLAGGKSNCVFLHNFLSQVLACAVLRDCSESAVAP